MSFPVVGGGGLIVILLGSPSMFSKSPRKQSKRPKISAVEKEKNPSGVLEARILNNLVCLSSLQANDWNLPGFNQSFVFQGRVLYGAGVFLPVEGEQPRLAKL